MNQSVATTCPDTNRVSDHFETGFMNRSLEDQIRACEDYVLRPLFVETFREHQPVLEAGCGSGQWMHYFKQQGIESTGIDWSETLRERSLAYDPSVRFDHGDMRDLPYPDESFGGVVAMGSPEHVPEGPRQVFSEFYRVLKPGGVAIVTMPQFYFLRSVGKCLVREPLRRIKRSAILCRLFGLSPIQGDNPKSRREVLASRYRKDVFMEIGYDGYFYQYQFTKGQFRDEMARAGFEIERCFGFNGEAGLIFSFGKLAGSYDRATHQPRLNLPARLIYKLLGDDALGHMICCVVRKPNRQARWNESVKPSIP
jgi:SAM-dependent methyltransferase